MSGASIWNAWASGRCPCCGMDLVESVNGVPCQLIGECVRICGRCAENEHVRPVAGMDVAAAMLESIAARSDEPWDRLDQAVTGTSGAWRRGMRPVPGGN